MGSYSSNQHTARETLMDSSFVSTSFDSDSLALGFSWMRFLSSKLRVTGMSTLPRTSLSSIWVGSEMWKLRRRR